MSATTSIEWTDRTWNPVTGCTKVSPGCAHCYAETIAKRLWPTTYPPIYDGAYQQPRPRDFDDVMTHDDRLLEPLSWRKPSKVFVNSMSDLFHEDVPDHFLLSVFSVMEQVPRHIFQILTKRGERMRAWVSKHAEWVDYAAGSGEFLRRYGHVYLGVSVENQPMYDKRIDDLLRTPAAVRFLSVEPMLGPIDLRMGGMSMPDYSDHNPLPQVDWVICGGESGPGARPFDLAWARSIVQQCKAAGVPVFVKQLGAKPLECFLRRPEDPKTVEGWTAVYSGEKAAWYRYLSLTNRKGGDPSEWPEDLRVREFPNVEAR